MTSLLVICFLAGGLGAVLQGMVGVGTGIIIIPLLAFLLPAYGIKSDDAMHIALGTTMAAIVFTSISALISHHKRGNVQWPIFKKIICSSLLGSFMGAYAASKISGTYLQMIFGSFMLGLAFYMFLKKEAKEELTSLPFLSLIVTNLGGLCIGFIASIIGTGGGVLMVPFLQACKIKMRWAVGTSTLIGLPVALVGALTYVYVGLIKLPVSSSLIGYVHWPAFLAVSLAGIMCAPLGAKLATILPGKILQRCFAICMIIVGIKMIT